ncbi:MAG: PAS domain-containing protein, partial [Clostridia bacterium]|nr:PAS domain-containing protein [Clostridia bacterium]
MIKSTQTKIILIIVLLAVLMFGSFGIFSIVRLENLKTLIVEKDMLVQEITDLKIVLAILMVSFLLISLVIIWFTKKMVDKPILKLIQSAKQIDQKFPENAKNDIDELTNAFDAVNTGLKENFNEVIRQKKQMETILRYMNDGIIAFNMKGKIIHINPAAKNLLSITVKEKTFEEIFNKLDEEINMEKLIYLDDWTSTEKRVNIEDKYLKLFFAPFKDENERPSGIIVLVQDITEHV